MIKRDWISDSTEASSFVLSTDRPEVVALCVDSNSQDSGAELIAQARAEADRIMTEAKRRAHSVVDQARTDGFQAGLAQGMEEVKRKYEGIFTLMQGIADQVTAEADALIRGSEKEIVKLAVAVAEKIVRRAVDANPGIILEIVREAVRKCSGARVVVVRVSPEDMESVLAVHDELMRMAPDLRGLKVVEDPRIDRGGCVVEMDVGSVDARIAEQLRGIESAFEEEAEHAV
ncbi:MAG: FliH/SctL family protein [Clostridia bacterium]|nr:FliH/SctL family protein [Clostridia bacterium]